MDFSDLGQLLFKWLHTNNRKRLNNYFSELNELDLENSQHLSRLDFICKTFNKQMVQLYLTDGLEFPDIDSVFLPRKLKLAQDKDKNFSIYLYRLMLFHGAIESGSVVSKKFQGPADALIQSSLAIPAIHRALVRSYSGFDELLLEVKTISIKAAPFFIKFNSGFRPWSSLLETSLQYEDFTLTNSDTNLLMKVWRSEWINSPACPLHALSILPQCHRQQRSISNKTDTHEKTVERNSSLPKASDAGNQALKIKTVARPEVKTLKASEENPVTHVFEKLLTADEYKGGSKTQDGSDESDSHADALSELTLDSVARTQSSAASILKSNAQVHSFLPDLDKADITPLEKVFTYPEWFQENQRYIPNFCTVYESRVEPTNEGLFVNSETPPSNLKEKLSSFLNESRWKPRQKDGVELDLDAIVRWRSQLHGSGPIDQHLYMGRRYIERNLAILILLDSSLSTDAWINNKRVLDVMKSSITMIGEAFAGLDEQFAIATFNSHARVRCNFKWIKPFDEHWRKCKKLLSSVKPEGYTRIGPALRHAHATLDQITARRKLILLFSDAKPSDYDHYEGVHGLSDVRKAVAEIKSRGIYIKGVTISQENRANLINMFGAGQYKTLTDSKQVANQIIQVFIELMKQR